LIGSAVLLAFAVAMGVVNLWDAGGLASKMRERLEDRGWWMPSWWERVFGVWCFVFGIGQFIFLYVTTRT
jgi:hypothetical protein